MQDHVLKKDVQETNCEVCLRSRCERRGAVDVSASDIVDVEVRAVCGPHAHPREDVMRDKPPYAFVTQVTNEMGA